MGIKNGYILPHPPIIVPQVGRGREMDAAATIDAVKKAAREIAADKPSTIILSSPHAPCFKDFVYISDNSILSGDLSSFGCPGEKFEFKNNEELAAEIISRAEAMGISAGGLNESQKWIYGITENLDHGALVPLYYISRELKDFKLVHISTPFLPLEDIYKFGQCIKDAVEALGENAVYVASGDLSHKLTKDAPAGYSTSGARFDSYLIDKLKSNDLEALIHMDEKLLEEAAQCGTRSFVMMLGALSGCKLHTEVYSYEGPFGVGYLIAKTKVLGREESQPVKLARSTLEAYVNTGAKIKIPDDLPAYLTSKKAGVFVSIKKNGMLRGCIGTIFPTEESIAGEIVSNAIKSGTQDPRFNPVRVDELPMLEYSVDILGEPEKINSIDQLDVKKYGVIVTAGFRRGLLLPDLQGVDTPMEQVDIALSKAGIDQGENYIIERFEVIRYK